MIKVMLDLIMLILLMALMARHFSGEKVHEWLGVIMLVLILAHNVLNRNWYKGIPKGKYSGYRIFHSTVNILTLCLFISLGISGMVMSGHVFAFLNIKHGIALARRIHMAAAYWTFVFIAFHIGLHWNKPLNLIRKRVKKIIRNDILAVRLLAVAVVIFGSYAFVKHNIFSYLFLQSEFAYFDFEQNHLSFFAEYTAMMGSFVMLAYYLAALLRRINMNTLIRSKTQ
jgi:hypothetical protein